MIDYQNLPDNAKVDWFMQPTATNEVHTWTKPSGCNFVYMITAGAGAGGAGGYTMAAGTPGNAGSGGGSGAINTLLVPAFLIPDTLFIKVGIGSAGGPPATAQNFTAAGGPTIISAYRVQSATEYLLFSNGGNGAASGTGSSNPAGGTGGASAITNNTLGTIGKWQGVTGNAGANGGQANGGGTNSLTFNFFNSGGAGGAGRTSTDVAGGSINSTYAQASAVTVVGGGAAVANATAGQNDGTNGFWIPKRFIFYGGGGGGASNNGVGGKGGKGAPSCGGGGGGTGVTGGAGGDGGDGFAVIISY